jgi:serine/threonine protein kinase
MTELQHPTQEQIDLFILGDRETIPANELEAHFARCDRCSEELTRQAQLESELREVAHSASFCPSCERISDDPRCGHCGCALEPGGYRVQTVLVQTPHGRVYLARSPEGRRVALKELVFTQAPSLAMIEAFEREGRILQQLRHPRIPRFYGTFTEGEGVNTRLYLAQEYIDGESLATAISKRRFDEDEVTRIARGVLEILCYLQGLSPPVFHRDIKPSNLIYRPGGSIVLVDFGSAREHGATAAGTLAGTFGYMPLEQMVGVVDATSDLYALGATMCHLLSRTPPWKLFESGFSSSNMTISNAMKKFLAKMTAQKPEGRFSGATEALDALEKLKARARPGGEHGPFKGGLILAFAGAVALAAGGGYLTAWSSHVAPETVIKVVEVVKPNPAAQFVPPVPPVPPVQPVQPVQPVRPVQPVQPVDPVDPIDPVDLPDRLSPSRRVAKVSPNVKLPSAAAEKRARAKDIAKKARASLISGDMATAEEGLKECLRLADLPECYRNLGVLYAAIKDTQSSIKYYRKYLELEPNGQDADYIRGLLEGAEN